MTTNSIISIAFALLCVVSIGVSSTTLESSMGTDPDEVIDLDWETVPIGEETAAELKGQIEANGDQQPAEGTRESDAARGDPERRVEGRGRQDESQPARSGDEVGGQARSQAQQAAGEPPRTPEQNSGLWLLVVLGLVGTLLVVGYRYRDRLGVGRDPLPNDEDRRLWPPGEPTTEVERAWLGMVGRLEVDRPWAWTPAEFAAAAVDAGMDAEAVDQVTASFVAVRYGGARVTERHRERARTAMHRLGLRPEGEPA